MKKILSLLMATALTTLTVKAQVATPDAAWCDVIEQVLSNHGVQANVRSDLNGSQKVLHVTVGNHTNRYVVPSATSQQDYSSPVYIIVDAFDHPGISFSLGNIGRGNGRMWMGSRTSSYMPDEVFNLPADVDDLQATIRTAVSRPERVTLIDGEFTSQAINSGVPLLVMKGTIIAAQRGEKFKPMPANQKPAGRTPPPTIDRTMAYAKVHIELTNYRTGEIVWGTDLSKEDYTISSYSDPMESVRQYIASSITNKLTSLYPSVAPRSSVYGSVLSLAEVKKDKAQSVHINLGTSNEVQRGDTFTVYESVNISNTSGATPIGTLTVEEVQGATLSLCKVKKGNREILSALQAGKTLTVRSSW